MVLCCILHRWFCTWCGEVSPVWPQLSFRCLSIFSSYSSTALKCYRFFRYMFLLFSIHQMALGLFRMMASLARDMIIANTFGSASLLAIFLLGGFIIPKGKACLVFIQCILQIQSFWTMLFRNLLYICMHLPSTIRWTKKHAPITA